MRVLVEPAHGGKQHFTIPPLESDLSFLWIQKARNQGEQDGFSSAAGAHQRNMLAGSNVETEAFEYFRIAWKTETHVPDTDANWAAVSGVFSCGTTACCILGGPLA